MKKIKKEVDLKLINVEARRTHFGGLIITNITYEILENVDPEKLKFYKEIEIPETFQEFIEVNNITEKKLVKWLNKNYKAINCNLNTANS